MGAMKSATTAMFWRMGRTSMSLIESRVGPPYCMACCEARIDISRKKVKPK
jgi:hypothetical protein